MSSNSRIFAWTITSVDAKSSQIIHARKRTKNEALDALPTYQRLYPMRYFSPPVFDPDGKLGV